MTTQPQHRRNVRVRLNSDRDDVLNDAHCDDFGLLPCQSTTCPRHMPTAYTLVRAEHRADGKHRRAVVLAANADPQPVGAQCDKGAHKQYACPRHSPERYTEMFAVHATDSVGKVSDRDPWSGRS